MSIRSLLDGLSNAPPAGTVIAPATLAAYAIAAPLSIPVLAVAAWQWVALRAGLVIAPATPQTRSSFDVVCLSHVAWSHIWQRNHHTMTRLARTHRVLYVQVLSTSPLHAFLRHLPGTWRTFTTRQPGLELLHPLFLPGETRFPVIRAINQWLLRTAIRYAMAQQGITRPVLWFYHPAAVHLLDTLPHDAVVYDIQDEYTAFRGAAQAVAAQETELLGRAQVMLAGTFALHETKKPLFAGSEAAFYPCAVEFDHFHRVALPEYRREGTPPPPMPAPELQDIDGPILFYMGLIDKRLDPAVIEALAAADSSWTVVLAGPVEPGAFPAERIQRNHPNVRFLGSQPYSRLPEYLMRTSVCLMPWAINDLTLHINPTKTLEYLATARPVVSIRLPDLEAFYRDSVALAHSPIEFVAQVRQAITQPNIAQIQVGLAQAAAADWDAQVEQMAAHVDRVLTHRHKADEPTQALPIISVR